MLTRWRGSVHGSHERKVLAYDANTLPELWSFISARRHGAAHDLQLNASRRRGVAGGGVGSAGGGSTTAPW